MELRPLKDSLYYNINYNSKPFKSDYLPDFKIKLLVEPDYEKINDFSDYEELIIDEVEEFFEEIEEFEDIEDIEDIEGLEEEIEEDLDTKEIIFYNKYK